MRHNLPFHGRYPVPYPAGIVKALSLRALIILDGYGIISAQGMAVRLHLRELALAGLIAGIGMTVALFVAGEAFTDKVIQGAAKTGALLSIICAIIALILGRLMKVKRF